MLDAHAYCCADSVDTLGPTVRDSSIAYIHLDTSIEALLQSDLDMLKAAILKSLDLEDDPRRVEVEVFPGSVVLRVRVLGAQAESKITTVLDAFNDPNGSALQRLFPVMGAMRSAGYW